MGRKIIPEIEPGSIFGDLVVLHRDFEHEEQKRLDGKQVHPYYRCVCKCGNETTVVKYNLLRGITKSCGCLQKKRMSEAGHQLKKDLTGNVFGSMVVLHQDATTQSGSGKHVYWICKCKKCGSQRSVRSSDLIRGSVIDCGCGRSERLSKGCAKDLSGSVFGFLHVIDRDYTDGIGTGGGRHARWNCLCEICGRVESVTSSVLIRYGKDRCSYCSGMSNGEEKISNLLTEHNITFKRNRSFGDCKYSETGWSLRFDFIVSDNDGLDTYIIEFDGIQHFKEVRHWESKINLDGRIKRDKEKNAWCRENGIPLIRIPYTHLKDISIDDLTPSKTEFLI